MLSKSALRPVVVAFSGGQLLFGGITRLKTQGSTEPSGLAMSPWPPETARMFNSKSCTSSRTADQLSACCLRAGKIGPPDGLRFALLGDCGCSKVLSIEIV